MATIIKRMIAPTEGVRVGSGVGGDGGVGAV